MLMWPTENISSPTNIKMNIILYNKLIFECDTIEELMLHVSHTANLEIMNRLVKLPEPPLLYDKRDSHLHEKPKQYQLNT